MATKCFNVVRGKRVRVTELNSCSIPVTGGSFVVSEGFVQVEITSELEDGEEYVQKNADGKLCVNLRAPDSLKRLNVTVDWCQIDPDIINLITGSPLEMSGADAVGFRIQEGEADVRWALELWTGLGDTTCDDGVVEYGYLLLPLITGSTVGDVTIENATATFQTTGYTEGNSGWGVGPYDVIGSPAAPLDVAISAIDHALIRTTVVAPPTAVCGAQIIT
jgi:hypothetical protein